MSVHLNLSCLNMCMCRRICKRQGPLRVRRGRCPVMTMTTVIITWGQLARNCTRYVTWSNTVVVTFEKIVTLKRVLWDNVLFRRLWTLAELDRCQPTSVTFCRYGTSHKSRVSYLLYSYIYTRTETYPSVAVQGQCWQACRQPHWLAWRVVCGDYLWLRLVNAWLLIWLWRVCCWRDM